MKKRKRNTDEKLRIYNRMPEDTPIGTSSVAGGEHIVCIPDELRMRHVHMIGRPFMGTTTLLMHMIINDIKNGHGVAVIDPHGDLVEGLLHLMPQEAIDRVVYFNPGDPDWIPLWNPMQDIEGQDKCRIANDLIDPYGDLVEKLLNACPPGSQNNRAAE